MYKTPGWDLQSAEPYMIIQLSPASTTKISQNISRSLLPFFDNITLKDQKETEEANTENYYLGLVSQKHWHSYRV